MKTILLTTDLSDESIVAFSTAKEYAEAFGASVEVITVVEDPAQAAMVYAMEFPIYPDIEVQKQLINKVESELKELVDKHLGGLATNCYVKEGRGPVHIALIDKARAIDADLIIIASHGRSGFKGLLIGSVAERVARHSECPVLIVPVSKDSRR